MSDKTFGVKVSEDLYDKVKGMIDVSGISSKEWFEKAVALTEIQNLKEGSGDHKKNLSELEMHTKRIYELVASMLQQADYMKMDAVRELEGKLESRDLTIAELQNNVKKLTENLKQAEEGASQSENASKELSEQLESFRAANDNNQALIQEYKGRIDTLVTLVDQYKGYAAENAMLKESFPAEKESLTAEFQEKESRMVSSIEELKTTARDQESLINLLQSNLEKSIEDHKNEIENLKVNQVNQLTQLSDKKEIEKERAILEIERRYQEKLEKAHDQYNEKLTRLFEKLDRNEGKEE